MNTTELRAAIASNPVWYHTIELAPGIVTPGYVDMRSIAERILPDDLSGKRVLDVGTFDGFWAFEMERRGAEVVAIDVEKIDDAEWPPHKRTELMRDQQEFGVELGKGFQIASEALGSKAKRIVCNIYDASPERVEGPVDMAFIGALLLHLRDPVRGLEAVRSTLTEGGELRMIEPFSAKLSLLSPRKACAEFETLTTPFNWWVANIAGLSSWLVTAGYGSRRRLGIFRPPGRDEMRQLYVGLAARPAGG